MIGFGCCDKCTIGKDPFSLNDGAPHDGFTFRPDVRGTAPADEPENSGGTYNFPAPAVECYDTANPEGPTSPEHAQVKAQLTESVAGDGAAADVFLGYIDNLSTDSGVYVRVEKRADTSGDPDPSPQEALFYGARHDFVGDPAGAYGDVWICPAETFKVTVTIEAPGHDGGPGTGGTPHGGYGGGGGAYAKSVDVPVTPGKRYRVNAGVFASVAGALVSADLGGSQGVGHETEGGRASRSLGDVVKSGGDGAAAGNAGGNGSGGGGGADAAGDGSNASGQIGGALQVVGADGGNSGGTGNPGHDAGADGNGGGGGGGSGSGGGAGGLGGTGFVKLEWTPGKASDCASMTFRQLDPDGSDYEIPNSPRIPITLGDSSEFLTIDACWIPAVDSYGDLTGAGVLRGKVKTSARVQPYCGEAYPTGAVTGSKGALGDGRGAIVFDDWKFTYFRGPEHLSCPNCNDSNCLIGTDSFPDDVTADDLGYITCFWHLESGTAQMLDGFMQVASGGSVKYLLPHPSNKPTLRALVDVKWESGIKAKLKIAGMYVIADSSARLLTAYDGAGQVAAISGLLPAVDNATHTLELCFSEGVLSGFMFGECARGLASPATNDPFAYLESLGGTVKFDNFELYKSPDESNPKDSGCQPCACQPADGGGPPEAHPCEDCCDDVPPAQLVVDLGGGGWIERASFFAPCQCGDCDSFAGEYVVDSLGDCYWAYSQDACAPATLCCNNSDDIRIPVFFVAIRLVSDDIGCYWAGRVELSMQPTGTGTQLLACDSKYESYRSDYLPDRSSCVTLPVTLTTIGGSQTSGPDDGPCDGSMPDTITVDNV